MLGAELLREWIDETEGMSQVVFAQRLADLRGWGAQQSQVSKWASGSQKPSAPNRLAIQEVTGGAVQVADWDRPSRRTKRRSA